MSQDDALLPPSVLRYIGDKMYEKRKIAALEVEQIMKRLANNGEREKIKTLLGKLVNDYALSAQANRRKVPVLSLILVHPTHREACCALLPPQSPSRISTTYSNSIT